MVSLTGRIVIFILPSLNFRDPEFTLTRDILKAAGVKIMTASTTPVAKGAEGLSVKVDLPLDKVDPKKYDAVIFVGGPGSPQYFDDATAHMICKDTLASGKLLCSICASVSTLARAGVLKGIRSTAFESRAQDLKDHGAIYTGKPVEIDGKIITANGPAAAKAFGEAIVKALMSS